jgi:hypothetical protein
MYKQYIRDTNLSGAYWQRLPCEDANVRSAAAAAFVG